MDPDLFYFLLDIAAHTPALEEVQDHLAQSGHRDAAKSLRKLIRDSGNALSQEFGVDDGSHGPLSAALNDEFEPVTWQRLQILNSLARYYPDNAALRALTDKLPRSHRSADPRLLP